MTEAEHKTEQAQTAQTDLGAELNRLGENLGKILKATWESEERKAMEKELKSGLEQFSKQINSAMEQTKTDQSVKKAKEALKDAWETAHGPQVLKEMHLGLVDSLKKLNDEIARRSEPKPAQEVKAEEPPQSTEAKAPDSQVDVEDASPPAEEITPE